MTDIPFLTSLTDAQQTAAGLPDPWPFAMADRVRFGEIDLLGHVNNVAYMAWFETLRTAYVTELGLTSFNPAIDPRIVIRSAEIRYVKEMLRGETYVATARTAAFRRTSFTIQQELWSSGELRASFSCILVTLEQDGVTRRSLSADFIETLRVEGAASEA